MLILFFILPNQRLVNSYIDALMTPKERCTQDNFYRFILSSHSQALQKHTSAA